MRRNLFDLVQKTTVKVTTNVNRSKLSSFTFLGLYLM